MSSSSDGGGALSSDRYGYPMVRLERERTLDQLVDQIVEVVTRQAGSGTFRLYGRRRRRMAYDLRDRLAASHDVQVVLPNRDRRSARNRYWSERFVTELFVRDHNHPSLRLRWDGRGLPVPPALLVEQDPGESPDDQPSSHA